MTITEAQQDRYTDMDREATRALDELEAVVGDTYAESEILTELSGYVRVMAQLAPTVYTDPGDHDLIEEQDQNAKVAFLLADLAQARDQAMPRGTDRIPSLEGDPEAVLILNALANPELPLNHDRADFYDRLAVVLGNHGYNGDLARAVAEVHRRYWQHCDEDQITTGDIVGTTVFVAFMIGLGLWVMLHRDSDLISRLGAACAFAGAGFYSQSLIGMYAVMWARFRDYRAARRPQR